MKTVFMHLKRQYFRIRNFKAKVAGRMLRQALQEFRIVTSNSKLIRQRVEKFQMDRVCNRFSAILGEWRVVTVYLREVTR